MGGLAVIQVGPPPLWLPPKPAIVRPGRLLDRLKPLGATLPGITAAPLLGKKAGGGVFSLAYGSYDSSDVDGTSFTFTGMTIGTAGADRYVLVCLGASDATGSPSGYAVSSLTVGGQTASEIVSVKSNDGNWDVMAAIWLAHVPAGTTADVDVAFDHMVSTCAAVTYALSNPTSTAADDTATDETYGSSADLSLTGVSGGAAVGFAQTQNGHAMSWSGLTEDAEWDVQTNEIASVAHATGLSSGAHTITLSTSTPTGSCAAASACFH